VLVDAYRRPEVPYAAGPAAAAAGAHAMCDVSDGLIADIGHIAASSGVRIDIESALLEIGEPIASVAAAYGTDPLPWVLSGGHDHALVAVFPAGDELPEGFSRIGWVRDADGQVGAEGGAGDGADGVTVDGEPWGGPSGHVHFGGGPS
jgi:thiamine-monophosphate kinase